MFAANPSFVEFMSALPIRIYIIWDRVKVKFERSQNVTENNTSSM